MNTAIISGRLVRDPGYNETQNAFFAMVFIRLPSLYWQSEGITQTMSVSFR